MICLIRRWGVAVLTVAALTAADLWTKHLVVSRFHLGESKVIIDGLLSLTLVRNTGAAFGVGRNWSIPFFVVTSVLAIAVVIYFLAKLKKGETLSYWALLLILSGALGNLTDRIRLGYVIDFIDVYYRAYHWPAFNVADAAITVGAFLFGLEIIFRKTKTNTTLSEVA